MKYFIWSESADDLMWEDSSLTSARKEARRMAALSPADGDHRYFPLLICREKRNACRRGLVIVERHTLTSVEKYITPQPMWENGEAH